jgi:uncharacterized membrane protein YgcG
MIQTTSIPTPDRATALTIVAGSILFLAAAFAPISRVFAVRDSARKLELILAAPNQWAVAQLLFALARPLAVHGTANGGWGWGWGWGHCGRATGGGGAGGQASGWEGGWR